MLGDPRLQRAFLRTGRAILIGFTAAGAVWGGVFLWQHQLSGPKNANTLEPGHVPAEWTLRTKIHLNRAGTEYNTDSQIEQLRSALDTLVSPDTDLRTKSADWLAGYADILRQLGLALVQSGRGSEAVGPLKAAQTIPLGSSGLRIAASVELYKLNTPSEHDPSLLIHALQIADPDIIQDTSFSLKNTRVPRGELPPSSRKLYLEITQYLATNGSYNDALAVALGLHRALATANTDPLCQRAAAAGYAAQLLWKLGQKQESREWLKRSEADAEQCQTAACRETAALAREMLARTNT